MSVQARALYPYGGQSPGDLIFVEGDIITVTSRNTGDAGWWCGELKGAAGYFPETYVEVIPGTEQPPPPSLDGLPLPPPPSPSGGGGGGAPASSPSSGFGGGGSGGGGGGDDDDDDEEGGGDSKRALAYEDMFSSVTMEASSSRASVMIKSTAIPIEEQNHVAPGFYWTPLDRFYYISVGNPEEKRKFAGVKKFVAYELVTHDLGWKVSRRYKHFSWLREQLVEKFPAIAIPVLPSKQVSGRFEQDFIEERRLALEDFLNGISRHPVLRRAVVFKHFLSVENEDNTWKAGKRRAEKDPVRGKVFYDTIMCEESPETLGGGEAIDAFKSMLLVQDKYHKDLIEGAEALEASTTANATLTQAFGNQLAILGGKNEGGICWRMDNPESALLHEAMTKMGALITNIGKLQADHATTERTLSNLSTRYRHLTKTSLEVAKIEAGARASYTTSVAKSNRATKLASPEEREKLHAMKERLDRIEAAQLAEMNFFHSERLVDFKVALRTYAQAKANYHANVAAQWTDLMAIIDMVPADHTAYLPPSSPPS